jgi:hypothetical protein
MRKLWILPVFVLAAAVVAVRADEKKDEKKEKSELEPKVLEILKQVGDLHKNAKSMHTEIAIVSDLDGGDGKKHIQSEGTFDMAKPNHFSLRSKVDGSAEKGTDVVCDGKKLFVRRKKEFTEEDAIEDLNAFGPFLQQNGGLPVAGLLFVNVLTEDPYDSLMQGVTAAKYAGTEKIGDQEAHHLKFEQPGLNWELWVATKGKPVVLKALSSIENDNGKALFVETYRNWKVDSDVDKDLFAFKPGDMKKVKTFRSDE